MFQFDPSISHVDPAVFSLNIAARTTALGEKTAKEIEDKKKILSPTLTNLVVDLGVSDGKFEGFIEVRANVIVALEHAFRGRIWATKDLETDFREVTKWVPVVENDKCSMRFVKLEFKVDK